jgi:hypothetical protein
MTTNILYLSYDGLTSHIGQSQVLPYLKELASRGHKISVVSFETSGGLANLHEAVKADLDHLGIFWHPRRFRVNPPLLSKIIDQIDFLTTARRLAKSGCFDIVHCRSYVAANVGLKLKKEFNLELLFDMRGFWVDQRLEGDRWPQSNLIYRYIYRKWKTKEAQFVENADEILSTARSVSSKLSLDDFRFKKTSFPGSLHK